MSFRLATESKECSAEDPGSTIQDPDKHQTPNTKHQQSSKSQIPNPKETPNSKHQGIRTRASCWLVAAPSVELGAWGSVLSLVWCLAFGVWCFGATPVHAQEAFGTVSGVVVNTWNGTPLAGVVVTVRGTTLAAQTDLSGRYELKNVPPGDQVLRFSKAGYASAVVTDVRVLVGQTANVPGNLRP